MTPAHYEAVVLVQFALHRGDKCLVRRAAPALLRGGCAIWGRGQLLGSCRELVGDALVQPAELADLVDKLLLRARDRHGVPAPKAWLPAQGHLQHHAVP